MIRKGDVEYFLNSTRFEETTEGHDGEASIMEVDNEVAVACSCEDNHDTFEYQVDPVTDLPSAVVQQAL